MVEKQADNITVGVINVAVGGTSIKGFKGFDKVDLQPGETQTVSFEIGKEMLSYFSAKSHDWTVDDATFDAYVCASSEDVRGRLTFDYQK